MAGRSDVNDSTSVRSVLTHGNVPFLHGRQHILKAMSVSLV
jgi:hypothetical protein